MLSCGVGGAAAAAVVSDCDDDVAREQLLRILLYITSAVLKSTIPGHREKSLGDRLAEHLLKVSCSSRHTKSLLLGPQERVFGSTWICC